MKKLVELFKKLNAYDHFTVFLGILSVLKIIDVFADNGSEEGLHYLIAGLGLFAISSLVFFLFQYLFDKKKKYQHALISTFIMLLILSHSDPNPFRGVLILLLLYCSKFFVKYYNQNIFNPIVFAIGVGTLIPILLPAIGFPNLDWSGIDIRYSIGGNLIPIAIVPICLSLFFNVARVKRHPLALSFIITSLLCGIVLGVYYQSPVNYVLYTLFIGAAIIVEPKTSPSKKEEQITFGIIIALIIFLIEWVGLINAPMLGMLVGNLIYFAYKNRKKWMPPKSQDESQEQNSQLS